MSQKRVTQQVIAIVISLILVSCASAPPKPTKQVKLVPKEIAAPNTKVYADPSVDWSKYQLLNVDLQQVGAPEHSRNQILERYLLQQAEDCFKRKGYDFSNSESAARVRIYFETKQVESQYSSVLAYGFSDTRAQGAFSTEYSLASGLWRSSMVAAAEWSTIQITNAAPAYEGKISIEIFDPSNTQQLWRGDVSTTLATDDIRIASNTLIRELLWHFPALDYPAVWVPEVQEQEFDRFKDWALMDREFYSPGQRIPISFVAMDDSISRIILGYVQNTPIEQVLTNIRHLRLSPTDHYTLRARYLLEFESTPEYEPFRRKRTVWWDQGEERRSKPYLEALDEYISQKVLLGSGVFGLRELHKQQRYAAAIADLLYTAPWSLQDGNGNVLIFGQYFIGEDESPTTIFVKASPVEIGRLKVLDDTYAYHRYVIVSISSVTKAKHHDLWRQADQYREMVLGPIDLNQDTPPEAKNPRG